LGAQRGGRLKKVLLILLLPLAACSGKEGAAPAAESAAAAKSTGPAAGKNIAFSFNLSFKSVFGELFDVRPSSAEFIFFNKSLDVAIGLPSKGNGK
jgi:hypothetical protein